MKYLLLALLVLSTSVMSAEKKVIAQAMAKKPNVAADTKSMDVDPADKTQERADETALYTDAPEVKEKITCKTKNGQELKAGEKGYKACIKKVKASKHDPKAEVKVEFEKQ